MSNATEKNTQGDQMVQLLELFKTLPKEKQTLFLRLAQSEQADKAEIGSATKSLPHEVFDMGSDSMRTARLIL